MTGIISILTCLLALVTIAPISTHPAWWVRVWDFPRLQILALALLTLLLNVTLLPWSSPWVWGLAVVNLACVIYQARWIYPYTPLSKPQVLDFTGYEKKPRVRILVANVLTPNRHAEKLLALAASERPDVLVAVETDGWWEQQLAPLEQDYPYTLKCPQDNLYGMHVYSRLPLVDAEIQYLVDKEIPSMHMLVQLDNGPQVRLHCVHPMPPSPTENDESEDRDAELVLVGKSVVDAKTPVIVTGDLNDVAWSTTTRLFLKISGLLDPRRGRGMYSTFHAGYPFLRWPLDHVFHSDDFVLGSLRRLPSIGSDHFPIMAELVYSPKKGAQQESLQRESEDEALAQEKLASTDATPADVHAPGA
ncbi:endonuclease/exonuclease/phosphatase family protein [Serratia rhizosphaerae]|uniref:endonuclease/exonuclease/phosphatase family protein n=1 Tax=unclassified Serratia (in: enterobacteria) TaxID=2647522 RepID=UPI000CF7124B|nr:MULTISPECIES: endonuclease/exonuclease/phosphatase family protein [unclassified Serratia (in: enterobacteria)]MBU3895105.1 endonuclease/exonuclease/phosphatase family protein [Serratia rubidaea]AVJ18335.1 endonuclease [Serratia sp. MYb239]MCA4824174.1 endonuclease/exonuclease/phosphatase family protein [Serratia rubidaea]QNK34167.1 endonuclease/exonuclease/phosphatase family protein [Serratia sp. JUb9]QPT11929.1 endonuclease/exonuclease/phosphatase family protein [Serratia rubidaea]